MKRHKTVCRLHAAPVPVGTAASAKLGIAGFWANRGQKCPGKFVSLSQRGSK